jgi:hypothetical protein
MLLIEPKNVKGPSDPLKKRFQDLLKYYKKSQQIRQLRIEQTSTFYK